MPATELIEEREFIRTVIEKRLRAPKGRWTQSVRLRSRREYDALPQGWAMLWRGFWFEVARKSWRSAQGHGWVVFRVL